MSKVALYVRVSTEEQARHGLSIDAQLAALRAWAGRNGNQIVGEYIDPGISGKKPPSKRPDLSRFFRDLEAGLSVDVLAFCKLDRFFRSVKLYYQAMEMLDRYKVAWQAIQEDYETVTASGRMKVNIMLSVAENEADRTSERIKAVFDRKRELGQPTTRSFPLGLKVEGKRLVHDENALAALAVFEKYAETGNVYQTRDFLQKQYGIRKDYITVWRMLRNEIYIGKHRDNPAFCEPIVPRLLWDRVQKDIAQRSTKRTPSGRVYLFSGLIVCAECGRRWTASVAGADCVHRERYRCDGHLLGGTCPVSRNINEYKLEQELLTALAAHVAGAEATVAVKKPRQKNKAAVERKLSRLKELFVEGDLDIDEYREKRNALLGTLQTGENLASAPRSVVGNDFMRDYEKCDRAQKKAFWRKIAEKIVIDKDLNVRVYFYE